MLALRLTVFCLLFCGSYGFSRYFYNLFNKCNPPQTLVGKFCAALFDNDVDGNGFADNYDFNYDVMLYNKEGRNENLCESTEEDVVDHWACRYGWSTQYGRFMFNLFDNAFGNGDGVTTYADFSAPLSFPRDAFLQMQYTRYKDQYCSVPANRENYIDRRLCTEVEALKPEDIKCD